jgi:uncharacterized protein (DUF433 family)
MNNAVPDYADHIVQDPGILAGKPIVRGTRIPVELVLAKLAVNPSLEELFLDFPRLTPDDVRACLEFASRLVGDVPMMPEADPAHSAK